MIFCCVIFFCSHTPAITICFFADYDGSTSWEKPEGFDAAKEEAKASGGSLVSPLLRAALRIQAVFRAKPVVVILQSTSFLE